MLSEVLMLLFIVFRNFSYFAQSRVSFNGIAFLFVTSRSRMPFFNSELIQGAFFILARLVQRTSKNFVFQSAHKTSESSQPLQVQSC